MSDSDLDRTIQKMSDEFIDFSECDQFPSNDESLSIEPFPNSFESPGPSLASLILAESVGSTSNDEWLNVPEPQRFTTPPTTVYTINLIEGITDEPKPFDGRDAFSADVVSDVNAFTPEDDNFECVLLLTVLLQNLYEHPLLART